LKKDAAMMETELKLLLSQQAQQQLREHPLMKKYAVCDPHVDHITDTYFDTSDFDVRKHDGSLRLRHLNDLWVQTLKSNTRSAMGGLHQREEWEAKVKGPKPDLDRLREFVGNTRPWAKLLRKKTLERKLAPVFTSDVTRTVWELRLPGGDEVESALDFGHLECNGRQLPISEFELELKSGQSAHLIDFALTLQKDVPLMIGNASKAERGYALMQPQLVAAVKAMPLHLSPQMTPVQGFAVIAANCLAQIQANQEGALQGQDVESLHQLRIGLLRLRSSIKIFRDHLVIPQALQEELAWLAAQLSAVRDWDVLAGTTLQAMLPRAPAEAGLLSLQRAVREKAHELHAGLSAIAGSPRYTTLILALTRLLQEESLAPLQDKKKTLWTLSRALLKRDYRRVKRRKQVWGDGQKARHRLRLAIKTARYDTEFFQSLYPPGKSRSAISALSALQEVLGQQNDALIADRLLQEFSKPANNQSHNAGFARGYLRCFAASEKKAMRDLWRAFMRQKITG
jgi:inorganic triphosphatase YgiF